MTRAGRLLAAIGIATLPLAAAAIPAHASPLPSPTDTSFTGTTPTTPVSVQLSSLEPVAPQPGDTLVLTGTVTNVSSDAIGGLGVELLMGPTLGNRGSFDEFADQPTASVDGLTQVASPLTPLSDATLDPGDHETFQITVPVNNLGLGLTTWQVHELGIQVIGTTTAGAGPVGQLRTFLPWAPNSARFGLDRLQIAWLWPLIDRPHRGVTPIWLDDKLAPELTTTGRLGRLVAAAQTAETEGSDARQLRRQQLHELNAGKGKHHKHVSLPPVTTRNVPVTWVIDPMLIDDAAAMRSPYQVVGNPKPTTGTGTTSAKTFLSTLSTAVNSSDVLPLPYADPDVTAAVRNGLATQVGVAATSGRSTLASAFPNADLLNTAWPAGGWIDTKSVNALFSDGFTSFVLSADALPPRDPASIKATPTSRASLLTATAEIPTMLTDPFISDAVTAGSVTGADPELDLQRFLAETLMVQAEAPTESRSLIVAPSRRWSPNGTYAKELLADTGNVPWLAPVTLQHILDSPPGDDERGPLSYPSSAKHDELSRDYLGQVTALTHSISEFASILPTNGAATHPYNVAVLRALSSAWRQDPEAGDTQFAAIKHSIDAAMESVHLATHGGSVITLTSHGGKLPITVANDLDMPVRVTVAVERNQRLSFSNGGRVTVTIPARQHLAVSIKATAKTSGVFPFTVHLLTPSGKPYGDPNDPNYVRKLFVRSTVYGTITLVITGAATAALLLAVVIRLTRRAIAARRPAAAG